MAGLRSMWTAVASPRARIQLRAVLRKNLLLTIRNKRDAVREFGMPLILLGVLVMLSNISANLSAADVVDYPTVTVAPLRTPAAGRQLWIAPCSSLADGSLAASVGRYFVGQGARNVTCFPCESPQQCGSASLLSAYPLSGADVLAAVVLDSNGTAQSTVQQWRSAAGAFSGGGSGSGPVRYRIRMDRGAFVPNVGLGNTTAAYGADGYPAPPDTTAGVWSSYFLPVQAAVDAALTGALANASAGSGGAVPPLPALTALSTRQFPSRAYDINIMGAALQAVVPIYMTLMFTLQVRVLLTRILEEKERKIKITLKMMGLTDAMFWLSWTVTALIKNTLLVTAIVAIACGGRIFRYSNFFAVWLFFFCFELTCVAFAFAVTSLFSKSRTGGAVGMLIYLACAAPSYAFTTPAAPAAVKLLVSLLAPAGFNLGVAVITNAEQQRVGLTWANFRDANLSPAGVSIGSLTAMLAFDALLYLCLAYYLDQVVPTEFGTTRHPLFCLGFRKGGERRAAGDDERAARATEQRRLVEDAAASPIDYGAVPALGASSPHRSLVDHEHAGSAAPRLRKLELPPTHAAAAGGAGPALATAPAQVAGAGGVSLRSTPASAGSAGEVRSTPSAVPGAGAGAGAATVSMAAAAATAVLGETADVEEVPPDVAARPGVSIRGLSKVFYSDIGAEGGKRRPSRGAKAVAALMQCFRRLRRRRRGGAGAAAGEVDDEDEDEDENGAEGGPQRRRGAAQRSRAGGRVAVDDLWLEMHEGQVTCLLGHNGAGKTTTVSMLTGLFEASSGDALVYGRSIANEMGAVRDMIGICPQHDTLFEQLSVEEHLRMCGGIKGLRDPLLQRRCDAMISELGLEEKRHTWAGKLSGGQRRRVSVAMAMIGQPKLLLLDEPTSGLDPGARRQVWQMVARNKAGRVTILTTHFMDEADVLGDRIALMARGRLRVAGSSLYLKNRFGLGYHLSMSAAPRAAMSALLLRVRGSRSPAAAAGDEDAASGSPASSPGAAAGVDVAEALSALVRAHVPSARFVGAAGTVVALGSEALASPRGAVAHTAGGAAPAPSVGATVPGAAVEVPCTELSFVLPHDQLARFARLFSALDQLALHGGSSGAGAGGASGAEGSAEASLASALDAPLPTQQLALPQRPGSPPAPVSVLAYSISITTLEEVFIRLAQAVEEEEVAEKDAAKLRREAARAARIARANPAAAAAAGLSAAGGALTGPGSYRQPPLQGPGTLGGELGPHRFTFSPVAAGAGAAAGSAAAATAAGGPLAGGGSSSFSSLPSPPPTGLSAASASASAAGGGSLTATAGSGWGAAGDSASAVGIAVDARGAGAGGSSGAGGVGGPEGDLSTWWWLDVRRRILTQDLAPTGSTGAVSGTGSSDTAWATAQQPSIFSPAAAAIGDRSAAAAAASAEDGGASDDSFSAFLQRHLPTPKRLHLRGSWEFVWRQITVQLWRRALQLKRDPRTVWLQCVTPMLFVMVGIVFRLLRGIGSPPTAVEVPLSPAGFTQVALPSPLAAFSLPLAAYNAASAPGWVAGFLASIAALFPSQPATAGAPTLTGFNAAGAISSPHDANAALFSNTSYAAGALLVSPASGASQSYGLTLMYNYTLTNALPALLSMWDSAALAATLNLTAPILPASAAAAALAGSNPQLLAASFDPLPALGGAPPPAIGDFLSQSLMGFYIALGYVTIPAIQAANVVLERESKTKQLQLIMGSTPLGYWAATWMWDALQYLIPWLGGVIIMLAASGSALQGADHGFAVALLLLLYGMSIPGPTYVLSFLFAKHPDAQMWTRLGYSGATIILFFGSFILEFPSLGGSSRGLQIAGDVFMYVAMLFPPYALSKGFADVTIKGQCNAALVAAGQPCEPPSAFTWELAGAKLLVMACVIPISMAVLMWIEYRTVKETRVDATAVEAATAVVPSAALAGIAPGAHGKQAGGVAAAAAAPLAPPRDLPPHLRDAWVEAQRRGALAQSAGPLAAGGPASAAPDFAGAGIEDEDVVAERQRIDAGLRSARTGTGAATAHGGYNAAGGWDVEADGYGALPGSTPERGPTGLPSSSSLSASARAGSPLGGHFTPQGTPASDAGVAAGGPTDAATAQLAGRGLTAVHLRKVYSGSGTGALPKVAVADLSFRVRPGEVFGLLGANGAGKTTTLSMLVAETTPSAGTAVVYGRDITAARRSALDIMGYCPQHDALFDLLTGAETLAYFAAINGVPAEHLPALVDAALSALDLQRYRDTLTRAYSGGNKRRLSLALAYVAAPLVVYLDECSTGVDPFARRRMFDVVQRARVGRSTVMTTHVLEDADGLCDRIAIMVDGRFACLGSSQHLKGRYGKGYSIELHLTHNGPGSGAPPGAGVLAGGAPSFAAGAGSDLAVHNAVATPVSPLPLGAGGDASSPATDAAAAERVAAITALVLRGAPAARLVESSSGHLRFEAPSVSLAVMFGTLEAHKAAAGIREYSVSQTTLEAVFLGFSRLQEQADERRRMIEAEFKAAAAAAGGQ